MQLAKGIHFIGVFLLLAVVVSNGLLVIWGGEAAMEAAILSTSTLFIFGLMNVPLVEACTTDYIDDEIYRERSKLLRVVGWGMLAVLLLNISISV